MLKRTILQSLSEEGSALPDADACRAARDRMTGHLIATPVRPLPWLSKRLGRPVLAKLEQIQHSGSFKFRGALNALLRLPRDRVVITASAGNHSLALAEAARRTGHRLVICMPMTASPIKRERLSGYSVSFVERGSTLDEALDHARTFAAKNGFAFVSPYNHCDVIAGSSTIGLEIAVQVPQAEAVVIPVGGGGLATGVGLGLAAAGCAPRLIGVQPARFASFASAVEGAGGRLPYRPTLADGLMVNPDLDSPTIEYARKTMPDILRLDEEVIAAGCLALLSRESLLCEPSGAIGVAAAVDGSLDAVPGRGPVVIVLSGGNLSLSILARVLAFPFRRPEVERILELCHRRAEDEPRLPAFGVQAGFRVADIAWDTEQTAQSVVQRLDAQVRELNEFIAVCQSDGLRLDSQEIALLQDFARSVRDLASRLPAADDNGDRRERLVRLTSRAAAFLDQAVAWQAPSYDQSQVPTFSMVTSQQSPLVNYTRYGSAKVAELEEALAAALGLDPAKASVLATSSGMAAQTLAEAYLLRYGVAPGDTVVCQPGLYFETLEQLQSNPAFRVKLADDDGEEALLAAVARHKPRAVFLEPLTNTPAMRLLNLRRVLLRLDATGGPSLAVVDGTLLSGAIGPLLSGLDLRRVELIYTESGSKYLQAGLDLTTLGLVAVRPERRAVMERLRRNTGTILYDHAAAMVPRLSRAAHLARMRRMHDNAMTIAAHLAEAFSGPEPMVAALFPGRPDHPDHHNAGAYHHLGGLMTLRFAAPGLNNRWMLDAAISHVLARAVDDGLAVTKGVSFGFSAPRLSAAWAMSETSEPFLRLSVGDGDGATTWRFARLLADSLRSFLDTTADWAPP